jgi:peptidoglycan LD-endopeptidase LytH
VSARKKKYLNPAGWHRNRRIILAIAGSLFLVGLLGVSGYYAYRHYRDDGGRTEWLLQFLASPSENASWKILAQTQCPDAPFSFPTDGYVGYLWGDTFQAFHRHQGIDIFGGGEPGQTPVFSASDGLLTRLPSWKSAVIIRIPSDPLHPGTEIWIYYAHMAAPDGASYIDAAFPAGTAEKPIRRGDFIGYQGNYSGDPNNPVGVHLHFSIVKDNGSGGWLNELEMTNTMDPSPYLGLMLRAGVAGKGPSSCGMAPT